MSDFRFFPPKVYSSLCSLLLLMMMINLYFSIIQSKKDFRPYPQYKNNNKRLALYI